MTEVKINTNKLVELINKYSVEVSFNGFMPFTHKVVNANKLLNDIHESADCTKEEFITLINTGGYKYNPMINVIFTNIQHQGKFKLAGHEALGSDSYIEHKAIKDIIPIN